MPEKGAVTRFNLKMKDIRKIDQKRVLQSRKTHDTPSAEAYHLVINGRIKAIRKAMLMAYMSGWISFDFP